MIIEKSYVTVTKIFTETSATFSEMYDFFSLHCLIENLRVENVYIFGLFFFILVFITVVAQLLLFFYYVFVVL